MLPAPIRVGVSTTDGSSLAGVTVTFSVVGGGGLVQVGSSNFAARKTTATDENGFADVNWLLGSSLGTQFVEVYSGTLNDPLTFVADAMADPNTLPLNLAQVIPLNNTADVSVTTALQLTFSRAVDRATVDPTTLFLSVSGDPNPVLRPMALPTATARSHSRRSCHWIRRPPTWWRRRPACRISPAATSPTRARAISPRRRRRC